MAAVVVMQCTNPVFILIWSWSWEGGKDLRLGVFLSKNYRKETTFLGLISLRRNILALRQICSYYEWFSSWRSSSISHWNVSHL